MKKVILVFVLIFSMFTLAVAEEEEGGIRLSYKDLYDTKSVSFKDEHNNVVVPANAIVIVTSKNGQHFGFITRGEVLFDFPAGDYMFAGTELVLKD
jgi:hypothetical protein